MKDPGVEFSMFRDGYELIAEGLSQAKPGMGIKVHMELIESMLDRWLTAKRETPVNRVERRVLRLKLLGMIADRLRCQCRPTSDGNMDPDPDLYVEPSGVIFYRPGPPKPGKRIIVAVK